MHERSRHAGHLLQRPVFSGYSSSNSSHRNLFRYKPLVHFPLLTMILEGRWRHAHDMFFFHCADKDPLAEKKGFWFRGARFHHVPGEPNKRWGNSRKRLGKVGVSRHDVENVNLTTCSHPSLCIRADSQEICMLFPIHLGYTWLYGRTLKTTVWTACNVSLLIELEILLYWFKTHMLQTWKKYQSLHHRNLPTLSWIHTHPYCFYRHTMTYHNPLHSAYGIIFRHTTHTTGGDSSILLFGPVSQPLVGRSCWHQ